MSGGMLFSSYHSRGGDSELLLTYLDRGRQSETFSISFFCKNCDLFRCRIEHSPPVDFVRVTTLALGFFNRLQDWPYPFPVFDPKLHRLTFTREVMLPTGLC